MTHTEVHVYGGNLRKTTRWAILDLVNENTPPMEEQVGIFRQDNEITGFLPVGTN